MSMMITTPYRTRPIRFLELYEADGWRLKVYGISATRDRPMARLVVAAKGVARQYLPSPAVQVDRYGVGTLIVHEGTAGNWVLLDWWVGENMLQHHVYASRSTNRNGSRTSRPQAWRRASGSSTSSASSGRPGSTRCSPTPIARTSMPTSRGRSPRPTCEGLQFCPRAPSGRALSSAPPRRVGGGTPRASGSPLSRAT